MAVVVVPSLLTLATQFVAVVVLAVLVPWFVGRFSRQYRELVRVGWERAEQMERERQLVAEQARLLERARIAQDMHDVLGHDLSLIALSAGALKLAPGLDEQHRRAAQDIRGRAAAAVERLGEVVGVLREESESPPRAPGTPTSPGSSPTRPPPGSRSDSPWTATRRGCRPPSGAPRTGSCRRP